MRCSKNSILVLYFFAITFSTSAQSMEECEIKTIGSVNNKSIQYSGGTWTVYSIDGRTKDGLDILTEEFELLEQKRAKNYIYFINKKSLLKSEYRISLKNGPWQRKNSDDSWSDFYGEVKIVRGCGIKSGKSKKK